MSLHLVINKDNKDKIDLRKQTIKDLGPHLAAKKFKEESVPF
jgi:hypothetical protein